MLALLRQTFVNRIPRMKPQIIERFADNGEFSHYELLDSKTGETLIEDIQEQIKEQKCYIRKGNEHQEPMIVYISGRSKNFECEILEVVNTGQTVFGDKKELLPFCYKTFKKMSLEWKIERQDKLKENYKKELDKLNYTQTEGCG